MQSMSGVKKRVFVAMVGLSFLVGITGCSGVNVSRLDAGQEVALTDRWNDEDSRLVSNEMIEDMFSYPWFKRFNKEHIGKEPTIIIQKIQNKSHEYIAMDAFVNDIKRAVMRSGVAEFIVSGEERDELKQQGTVASEDTRMEMEASFALSGSINSMVDQLDGQRVTFYQVDMKLINLQTTREVWSGQKKIKKLLERSRFSF